MKSLAIPVRRFYAINLILSGGLFLADALSGSLFLSRFGFFYLPAGLVGSALLSIAVTALLTPLVNRLQSDRLLIILSGGATVVALLAWLGLSLEAAWAIPLLFVSFRPIRDLLTAQFWNYAVEQYDAQEAKRYLPILGSAGQLGAILGGLGLFLMVGIIGPTHTLLGLASSLLLSIALTATAPHRRLARVLAQGRMSSQRSPVAPWTLLQNNPLVLSMTIAAPLTIALVLSIRYQTSAVLVSAFPDAVQLGTIYATAGMVAYATAWAFQAFVLPRVIHRLGLPRTNLLYPALAMTVGTWLSIAASVPAAMAGFATRTAFRQALQVPVEDLLLNAVASRIKAQTRSFLRGVVIPSSAIIPNLLLIILQQSERGADFIAILPVLLAVASLGVASWTGRMYRAATLTLVKEQNLIVQRFALQGFGMADPKVLGMLRERMTHRLNEEDVVLLAEIMVEIAGSRAEKLIVEKIVSAPPALQVALLEVLTEHRLADSDLQRAAPALVCTSEPAVRRATLEALYYAQKLDLPPYLGLLDDPEPHVQLAAVRLVTHFGGPEHEQARSLRDRLVTAQDPGVRAKSVALLAESAPERLADSLADPSPLVRQAAAEACAQVPDLGRMPPLFSALKRAALDPTEAIRRAALAAVARTGSKSIPTLVTALGDRSPALRTFAIEALVRMGQASIPALRKQTEAADLTTREAAITALARLDIERRLPELVALEAQTLQQACATVRLQSALSPPAGPAGELFINELQDELQLYLDRLYRLLAATEGTETARAIRVGLESQDRSRQAQAWEALENVRSPWRARIMTALAGEQRQDEVMRLANERWDMPPLTREKAWDLVKQTDSLWRQELVRAAQAEMDDPMHAGRQTKREATMLSVVEKAIFLKVVPSFRSMTTEQLQLLATASEELDYPAGATIFQVGDPGDRLFVIVTGRVGIEEKRGRSGSIVRISTLDPKETFGELAVFDAQPHTTYAVAIDDCHLLAIRRDVLLDLIRQYPDLSFEIIKLLSQRLREATATIAQRTKARPQQIVDLFDQLAE